MNKPYYPEYSPIWNDGISVVYYLLLNNAGLNNNFNPKNIYIGHTTTDRFKKRMREHETNLVKSTKDQNAKLLFAETFENRAKAQGNCNKRKGSKSS